jgi:hypothetical protein
MPFAVHLREALRHPHPLRADVSVDVPDIEDFNSGRPELKGDKRANASRDPPTRQTVDRLKCLS